eukprot:2768489-Ditylum_brightwellii.AAC.1
MGRGKGRLLKPTDIDAKTGKTVNKVLLSKHSSPPLPLDPTFLEYDELLAFIDLDITRDTVTKIASHMQGTARP